MTKMFPVIDLAATGANITRLRKERGLTVRDLQNWFGFEEPQAIYKWQKGKSLPTVDNLYALGALLEVPMEEILVPCRPQQNIISMGQQENSCCPISLPGSSEYGRTGAHAAILSGVSGLLRRFRKGNGGTDRIRRYGARRQYHNEMKYGDAGWVDGSAKVRMSKGGRFADGWRKRWMRSDHPERFSTYSIQCGSGSAIYAALWFICA